MISRINTINLNQNFKRQKVQKQNSAQVFENNATKPKGLMPQAAFDKISFGAKKQIQLPKSAETTIDWALKWDKEKRKKELDIQYEKAVSEMSFWKRNFTDAPDNLRKIYDKTLEKEEVAYNTLLKNIVILSNQQNQNNTKSEENKIKEQELNKRMEDVKKLELASKIASSFKIPDSGCLDDNIAGYESEKEIVRELLTRQVAFEKSGSDGEVPNSLLFYGPIGTGKTNFVRAIANEIDAELVEMNSDPDNFISEVYTNLKKARQRYLETGKRTVISINEIEAHLEDTKINNKNITLMKSWLECCAKLPSNNMQNAFATTFLFSTNHPLDISDEIYPRKEKVAALISLEPAANGNIEEIIKFYIKKFDKDGTLINIDDINFKPIIQKMNPDNEKGAFGNDKIKHIVKLACSDFNQNLDENITFEKCLNERIDKAKRNIKPERLQQFQEQLEELYED